MKTNLSDRKQMRGGLRDRGMGRDEEITRGNEKVIAYIHYLFF